jgi:hypothetical protein
LAIRWRRKKTKKITQKKKKILIRQLVSKGLNHRFTFLKTSQSLNCEGEYLQSTRVVRSHTSYNQPDTFGTYSNLLTLIDLFMNFSR